MKRIAMVCAAIMLAACTAQEEAPAVDTAAPAMAPAPADTGAMMTDTAAMDTTAADTATPE